MGRQVIVGQNLSGRTINVTAYPDGHARESYIGGCDLRGTTIIGDIRGSDILGCQCEGIDLSQAQTYGCQWAQSTFNGASIFPDSGAAQYQITYELLRRYIAASLPTRLRSKAQAIVAAHQAGDYATFCQLMTQIMAVARDRDEAVKLYQAMPPRMRERLRTIFSTCDGGPPRTTAVVVWPDSVQVAVNAASLPPLPRPRDRYELKLWIMSQAGPVSPDCPVVGLNGHFCFVQEIAPDIRIAALAKEDDWLLELQQF